MLQMQPWKIVTILLICVFGFFTALPNFLPADMRESIQRSVGFLPTKPNTYGLYLQGGVYVLFEAQIEVAVKDRLQDTLEEVRRGLRKEKITYSGLSTTDDAVRVQITETASIEAARTFLKGLSNPVAGGVAGVSSNE
ncbi:MAG: protein translocase subunit SecDF, partial [Alphaproteobacteria bacterium]